MIKKYNLRNLLDFSRNSSYFDNGQENSAVKFQLLLSF